MRVLITIAVACVLLSCGRKDDEDSDSPASNNADTAAQSDGHTCNYDSATVGSGTWVYRVRYQYPTGDEHYPCRLERQSARCVDGALGVWSGTFVYVSCQPSQ